MFHFDASMRKDTRTLTNKRKNVIIQIYETCKSDLVIQLVVSNSTIRAFVDRRTLWIMSILIRMSGNRVFLHSSTKCRSMISDYDTKRE